MDIKELYSISPEDRRSITIIEDISATGYNDIPPFIIVQGQYHMKSWYKDGLKRGEKVITSQTGFSNEEIALCEDHEIARHCSLTVQALSAFRIPEAG